MRLSLKSKNKLFSSLNLVHMQHDLIQYAAFICVKLHAMTANQ